MFKANRSYVSVHRGHDDFMFSPDGISLIPRAHFEISDNCPQKYMMMIETCLNNGWLKPVANMRDTEYTMELLQK